MKKLIGILMIIAFFVACQGNPGKGKETTQNPLAVEVDEGALQEIEEKAGNIADEAENLVTEIDSLIEKL